VTPSPLAYTLPPPYEEADSFFVWEDDDDTSVDIERTREPGVAVLEEVLP
jgi:hypothetical protein